MAGTLLKLLGPFAGIGILLLAARKGRLSRTADLALTRPAALATGAWLLGWLGWIVATELLRGALGMPPPGLWPSYPTPIFVLRIVAIGMAGPLLEELLFRGVAYNRLLRTPLGKLGPFGVLAIIAAGWALIHLGSQPPAEVAFTFVDGVVLGVARWQTRSIVAPAAMHATGNLYSIGQSLGLL
jgi:membrane protease YdiL (CAAX protease family)